MSNIRNDVQSTSTPSIPPPSSFSSSSLKNSASFAPPLTSLPAKHRHFDSNKAKFLGITPPVSTLPSPPLEEELSKKLLTTLKKLGLFESEEEAKKREIVLGKLYQLVREFVKQMGMKRGLSESLAEEAGGTIFTFGSYRLGVHGAGADIDTLCVVPRHVTREDFFDTLVQMLKDTGEVTELTAVPDAYVPVVKMEFSGIPIDLLFARLNLPQITEELDLSDNNLLRNLDERDVRSLNGSRVTDSILSLVPDVFEFRIALRCIKLWAKRRGIYSNVMGFLGGVAWAMLAARVCQLYPNACAGTLVSKFFLIMHKWEWPQPVLLKPMEEGPLNVRIWNPKLYPSDKLHRMPIITPAYPSMCATHNVTVSTHTIMVEQFREANEVVNRIMLHQAPWEDLFVPYEFFGRYRHYLQIIASSNSKEMHLRWSGLVESRLRQLVMKLEVIEGIALTHPYLKGIERSFEQISQEEYVARAHGFWADWGIPSTTLSSSSSSSSSSITSSPSPPQPEPNVTESNNASPKAPLDKTHFKSNLQSPSVTEPTSTSQTIDPKPSSSTSSSSVSIFTASFYIGLKLRPAASTLPNNGAQRRQLNISWPSREFMDLVTSWEHFNAEHMSITVQNLKRAQLPQDLRDPVSEPMIKKRTAMHTTTTSTVPNSSDSNSAKRYRTAPVVTVSADPSPPPPSSTSSTSSTSND